jgi:tetratricopeptide (TPR) repeat protein
MVAIPEKGSLGETPLPRLLLDLHRARFDGAVRLSREHMEKTLLFQRGIPIFAESNRASETLGVQLLDCGRITRDDHTRISTYVQEHKCKEGKALLDLGMLDPKALFVALKEQVRARVVDCFGWPEGEFTVEPTDAPNSDAQPFRADVYSLIQEGIEVHWSAERILGDLSANMASSVRRTRLLSRVQERLRWDDGVESFIDALDGSQTLWRAVQNTRSPRALAAAWVLDAIGALDYQEPDASAETAAAPEIEIALRSEAAAEGAARVGTSAGGETKQATGQLGEDLLREIAEKYARLSELDHYATLGLERGAARAAIKRAYLEAAKRYHPDALLRVDADAEVREQAGKVFAAIGKAHSVLSNAARRKDYDARLDSDAPEIDVERLAAAERSFRKAEILMRVGDFRGALEFLEPAVELWPEEAAYQAALGWSLYKQTPPEPDRAREHLERAFELDPSIAQIAFHLSVVLKALGDDGASEALLTKARSIDPSVG